MDELLVSQDAWLLSLTLAVLMLVAWGLGLRMGRMLRARDRKARWSKFDEASLALLGLLLAFTFSMSISRHEDRRTMVIRDSNAIGDFYTCASLLDEPVRSKLQNVIRAYAALRLKAARDTQLDQPGLEALLVQFQHMQDQMTELVGEALRAGTPIAVPLTSTLNQVASVAAERVGAIENRLPAGVAMLLFVSALVAAMLVGREQGFEEKTELPATLSFILLVTLAVYVTLDLNQPQRGLVTVSQAPIERLVSSMNQPTAPAK
ncbi:MAG TPA: hypothetical protein VMU16_00660 [Candidatus Binataceae bacterium]|nr:hypothetical protein [Candidatus Binataceae bacterium]